MTSRTKYLQPSAYELIGIFFLSIGLLLVANSHQLLTYYGLESSSQVIHSSTGAALSTGLSRIDQFRLTDQVVIFLIWSLVGAFCFSIIRAISGMYSQLQHNKQLSSDKYVHPETFTKANFWRQVILEFAVLFAALLVSVLVVYGLVAFVLPTALAYSRTFLIGLAPGNIGYLLIGLAITYVWLVFLAICLHVVIRSRQLVQV